jgi:hypothetical protein
MFKTVLTMCLLPFALGEYVDAPLLLIDLLTTPDGCPIGQGKNASKPCEECPKVNHIVFFVSLCDREEWGRAPSRGLSSDEEQSSAIFGSATRSD